MASNYDFGMGEEVTSQDVNLKSVFEVGEGFRPKTSAITNKEVEPKYPALVPVDEVNYKFQPLDLFGVQDVKIPFTEQNLLPGLSEIKTVVSRTRDTADYSKLTPLVKTENFYDLMGNKDDADMLNNATGVINKKGETFNFPGDTLEDKKNLSLDQKMKYADRVQGVKFVEQWGNQDETVEYDIPFEDALVNELQLPSDLIGSGVEIPNWLYTPVKDDILNPDGKTPYEMLLDGGFDSNLTKTFYARQLNRNLIAQGITDKRTRLGIIKQEKSFGAGLSIMASDLDKIGGSLRESLKFPIAMAGWIGAEISQALSGGSEEGNLMDSAERHKLFEKYLPEMAGLIQDRLAQNNVSVTYDEARLMASNYSGIGTAVLGVAAAVAAPSKYSMMVKSALGSSTVKKFDKYYNEIKGPNGIRKNASDDLVYKEFLNIESQKNLALTSPLLVANVFKYAKFVPIVGRPIAGSAEIIDKTRISINRFMVTNRLQAGMQIKDAAKLIPENRDEVAAFVAMRETLLTRRASLSAKLKKVGGDVDLDPSIKAIDLEIINTTKAIQETIALSSTPRFIREANAQDKIMVLGGAVGNQIAQQYNFDPQMGEVGGLFTGLIGKFIFFKGGRGAFTWVRDNLAQESGAAVMKMAETLAQKMNTFTPEFAKAVRKRMEYYEGLKIILGKAGVSPELLNSSFAKMSGLSFLQIIEEGDRLNVKAKSLINFSALEKLQSNADIQLQLVNELRSAIVEIEAVKGVANSDTSQKLLKMMKSTLQDADSSVKQLTLDIGTVNKFGKERVKDFVLGKVKGDSLLDDTTNEALDVALHNIGVDSTKLIEKSEVTQINVALSKAHTDVVDTVQIQANVILGQGPISAALEGVKSVTGKKNMSPSVWNKPGKLLSLLIESKYASRNNIAGTNYRLLDDANFMTADGKFVGGNPYVDGGNALSDLIERVNIYSDTYALGLLNASKGISSGQQTKLFSVFDDIAENFISEAASKKGIETAVFKSEMVEALKEAGKHNSKLSDNINIVHQLRNMSPDGTSIQSIKINFEQLKEFKSALSHLQYKATQAGNDRAAMDYNSIQELLTVQMNKFVIKTDEGVSSVGSLYVKRNGELVSVENILKDANKDWGDFKEAFFGDGVISTWMGKGKGGKRKKVTINIDNPMGINYGKNPEEWLDLSGFLTQTPEAQQTTFLKIANALGEIQTPQNQIDTNLHGSRRINPDSKDGKAFGAILDNVVANWMSTKITDSSGAINMASLQKELDKLQTMFMGTKSDGTTKSLINVQKVFDEKFAFNSKNLGEEAFNKQMSKAESAYDRNVVALTNKGATIRDGIIAAKTVLAKYDPENVAKGNFTEILFENGGLRVESFKTSINTIRRSANKPELSSEQLDEVLSALLIDTIDNVVFVPTGNWTAVTKKSSGVYTAADMQAEHVADIDKLKQLLGYGDSAKAKVIEDIVGKDRYKLYKSIVEHESMSQLKPAPNTNLTGVPTQFRLESYISRFYSINRGVISARYVGTEAILQQMRLKNMRTLKVLLTNPDAAALFMKSIQTGKPLNAIDEESFFNALAVGMAYISTHHEVINKVDVAGQYKVYTTGNKNINTTQFGEFKNYYGDKREKKARPDSTRALNEALKKQSRLPFPLGTNKSLDRNKPPQS